MLIAVLAVGTVGIYTVYADGEDGLLDPDECGLPVRHGWGFRDRMGLFSEEQRSELNSEIQDLIESKMEGWGIERPEPLLTEEQKTELEALISDLKTGEATCTEIQNAVKMKMTEWGIELPEMPQKNQCFGRFTGRRQRMMPSILNDAA